MNSSEYLNAWFDHVDSLDKIDLRIQETAENIVKLKEQHASIKQNVPLIRERLCHELQVMDENRKTAEKELIDLSLSQQSIDPMLKSFYKEVQRMRDDLIVDEKFKQYFVFLVKLFEYAEASAESAEMYDELQALRSLASNHSNLNACIGQFAERLKNRTSALLVKKLEATLKTHGWPNEFSSFSDELLRILVDLIQLQNQHSIAVTLAEPIIVRFKYHFESRKSTNRLDKPEWFFAYILKVIKEQTKFIQVLDKLALKYDSSHTDLSGLFILQIISAIDAKITKDLSKLTPSLLSNYIFESLKFDYSLKQLIQYKMKSSFDFFKSDVISGWLEYLRADFQSSLVMELEKFAVEDYEGFPLYSSAIKLTDLFDVLSENAKLVKHENIKILLFNRVQLNLFEVFVHYKGFEETNVRLAILYNSLIFLSEKLSFCQNSIEYLELDQYESRMQSINSEILSLCDELLEILAKSIASEFASLAYSYQQRRDEWNDPMEQSDISAELYRPLLFLQQNFDTFHQSLRGFDQLWRLVCPIIDEFLYENVVRRNKFTSIGIKRLQTDMNAFYQILKNQTKKPENWFRLMKESLLILNDTGKDVDMRLTLEEIKDISARRL